MMLVRIILALLVILAAAWAVFSFAPRGVRDPAIFLLIVFVYVFYSDAFRNWRLRRKLDRISRESIKRMSEQQGVSSELRGPGTDAGSQSKE